MASSGAELNLVLDGIIVVLVFVLLYLVYRKVIAPEFEERQAVQFTAPAELVEETRAIRLMEERATLKERLADLKARLKNKEMSKAVYKQEADATKHQLAHAELQLKEMGLL